MAFDHKPVMPHEAIEALDIKPGGTYVDGTLGGGGHAELILQQLAERRNGSANKGKLIGIDKDEEAIRAARERLTVYESEKLFVKGDFHDIKSILEELGQDEIDGALLDLGVSSYQLDEAERGFTYMQDTPLDMRMDQSQHFSAKDVVNDYSEQELARIIKEYGEERWAKRIATFIAEARKEKTIETTGELVDAIKKAIPAAARRDGPHPAKRTFQAIRIEVNGELEGLGTAIDDLIDILAPGGRLAVISFHSLEDRIAKETIARRADPCTCPPDIPVCVCGKTADIKKITKKPLLPTDEEIAANPRSRSAKMRIAEKI